MIVRAVAARVIRELMRDRRTLAFFLLVPVAIMTLVYIAVTGEEEARLAVVSRGAARLFDHDMKDALEETDEIDSHRSIFPMTTETRRSCSSCLSLTLPR